MALSPSSVPLVQHEPVSVLSRFGRTESDILPNSDCAPSWKLGASFGFFTHAEYPPNTPSSLHPPQNRSVLSAAPMPSAVPEGVPLLARVFESRVSCDLGVTRTPSICVVTTSDQLVQAQYVAARILEQRHGAAAEREAAGTTKSLESQQQFASDPHANLAAALTFEDSKAFCSSTRRVTPKPFAQVPGLARRQHSAAPEWGAARATKPRRPHR